MREREKYVNMYIFHLLMRWAGEVWCRECTVVSVQYSSVQRRVQQTWASVRLQEVTADCLCSVYIMSTSSREQLRSLEETCWAVKQQQNTTTTNSTLFRERAEQLLVVVQERDRNVDRQSSLDCHHDPVTRVSLSTETSRRQWTVFTAPASSSPSRAPANTNSGDWVTRNDLWMILSVN